LLNLRLLYWPVINSKYWVRDSKIPLQDFWFCAQRNLQSLFTIKHKQHHDIYLQKFYLIYSGLDLYTCENWMIECWHVWQFFSQWSKLDYFWPTNRLLFLFIICPRGKLKLPVYLTLKRYNFFISLNKVKFSLRINWLFCLKY